jgi:trimeric autotransporter adhesin
VVLILGPPDIWPGRAGTSPGSLTDMGGTLFFRADDRAHGSQLWRSDGAESGTVMVNNILPLGPHGASPESLTDVGGTLFFAAEDSAHGRELWRSDG